MYVRTFQSVLISISHGLLSQSCVRELIAPQFSCIGEKNFIWRPRPFHPACFDFAPSLTTALEKGRRPNPLLASRSFLPSFLSGNSTSRARYFNNIYKIAIFSIFSGMCLNPRDLFVSYPMHIRHTCMQAGMASFFTRAPSYSFRALYWHAILFYRSARP